MAQILVAVTVVTVDSLADEWGETKWRQCKEIEKKSSGVKQRSWPNRKEKMQRNFQGTLQKSLSVSLDYRIVQTMKKPHWNVAAQVAVRLATLEIASLLGSLAVSVWRLT